MTWRNETTMKQRQFTPIKAPKRAIAAVAELPSEELSS